MTRVERRGYEDYLETQVVVLLKNGKYAFGRLKSYDQYNNIALNHAAEVICCDGEYAERQSGLVIIRGENIVMLGAAPPVNFSKFKAGDFDTLESRIGNKTESNIGKNIGM